MEHRAGPEVPPSRLERGDVHRLKPAQPIGLQTRHLEALVAVATEGSFSGAARKLGYTPSAVSQQIAALERVVGRRLIDRAAKTDGAKLTEAGTLLFTHAESIVAAIYAAESDLIAERGESAVRVAAVRTVAPCIFPAALRRFRDRYAHKPLELVEHASSSELVDFVESGLVDAAFVSTGAAADRPLDVRPILSDEFVLAVRADSELARLEPPVALREVPPSFLVGFDSEASCGSLCAERRRWATYVPQADARTLLALVQAGLAAALVPRFTVADVPAIAAVEIADAVPRLEIALVTHAQRSRLSWAWLDGLAEDLETAGRRQAVLRRALRAAPNLRAATRIRRGAPAPPRPPTRVRAGVRGSRPRDRHRRRAAAPGDRAVARRAALGHARNRHHAGRLVVRSVGRSRRPRLERLEDLTELPRVLDDPGAAV